MPTKQDFIQYLENIQTKYYNDPIGLAVELFKIKEISWQEREIMMSVVNNLRTTVRSGHHIGKDFVASMLIWWFMLTHTHCEIICSANNKDQLKDVLWTEVARWKHVNSIVDSMFEWTADRLFHKAYPETWWAVARTSQKGEGIVGRHAKNQLIILDEVSGMDDSILEASEGLSSGDNVRVLLISNPTRNIGYFYRTHTVAMSKWWKQLHFSSLDSPFASKEWLEYMAAMYQGGDKNNVYRVKVLGEFPTSDANSLIPLEWIEMAAERPLQYEREPIILGVDVGAGGDNSEVCVRQGGMVHKFRSYSFPNTMDLVRAVIRDAKELGAWAICIDSIQLGKGPYDVLKESGICNGRVFSVDGRRKSYDNRFKSLRDELCWRARTQFENGLVSIPQDEDFRLELSAVGYRPEAGDKLKVDERDKIVKAVGHSANKFDAYRISLYIDDNMMYDVDDIVEDDEDDLPKNKTLVYNKSTGY